MHDVRKVVRVGAVYSERIWRDGCGEGQAGTCLKDPAKLPSACCPAQNTGKPMGVREFPGVADHYVVRLVEVGRSASNPRVEKELAGQAIAELVAIGGPVCGNN